MTHLHVSPHRARVLRWCERQVEADTVAIWSPEDKQVLAGLVADGLALPTGTRYELTPDGRKALRFPSTAPTDSVVAEILGPMPTEAQWDAMMEGGGE